GRGHQAVEEPPQHRVRAADVQQVFVGAEGHVVRQDGRRDRGGFRIGLDRGEEHPHDRPDEHQRQDQQEDPEHRRADQRSRRLSGLRRRSRRVLLRARQERHFGLLLSRMARTLMIETSPRTTASRYDIAAALPMRNAPTPSSRNTIRAVRVESPGPPFVTRSAWPNMLAEASTVIVTTKIITIRIPGSVTWRNCCHADAPSTLAAS